ncbi:hypothetical protein L3X38_003724 [Prunus dulcis]|uniref:Uncharacterized protein n=1 Tax=Prunus dulcis TaxID=3755 RepID=A0AAD4ZMJ8_PRUDU|nr:hypothetical protein L3X38_003724 [Prunus dulcis]
MTELDQIRVSLCSFPDCSRYCLWEQKQEMQNCNLDLGLVSPVPEMHLLRPHGRLLLQPKIPSLGLGPLG